MASVTGTVLVASSRPWTASEGRVGSPVFSSKFCLPSRSTSSCGSTALYAGAFQRFDAFVRCSVPPTTTDPGFPPDLTKLYVSGLSFKTTEESLRNAFEKFGRLTEVNVVMDRVAKRSRGFAFIRYATSQESEKAIQGMHGKFLDGRVIFVQVAKPRSQLRRDATPSPGLF